QTARGDRVAAGGMRLSSTTGHTLLEEMRHEVELLVHEAQAVEDHGLDRMAGGHNTHARVLLSGFINDLSDAEFFKHPFDQAEVIQDLRTVRLRLWRDVRAVRWSHSLLLL